MVVKIQIWHKVIYQGKIVEKKEKTEKTQKHKKDIVEEEDVGENNKDSDFVYDIGKIKTLLNDIEYSQIEKILKGAPLRTETTLEKLIKYFQKHSSQLSLVERAWLVYRWVTENIEYDFAGVNNKNYDISENATFNRGKSICSGYSGLYKKISDNLEVKSFDSNYYTILRQIGKGSYGKIYLVEDPKTQEQFALKKIIIGDALELKENQEEYKLTWKLTKLYPELKIVKKYAIEIKKLDKYNLVMYVLMEAANCDWEQELINRQKDNAFYTELELIEILKSLVNTFAELQKRGISHRDVKPQNILCFGKDGYKLSDFGEAKTKKKNYKNLEIDDNTRKQTVRGTELYMSPILFKALQLNSVEGAQYNAYKSDVFSLGMCFLLASSLNYQSLFEIREVYDMRIIKEVVEKYLGKMYSQNYINLVLNMLQINEKLRPDFI